MTETLKQSFEGSHIFSHTYTEPYSVSQKSQLIILTKSRFYPNQKVVYYPYKNLSKLG